MMSPNPLRSVIAAVLFGLPLVAPAQAEVQSVADIIQIELREGWQTDRGTRMAALHLTLAPGWKTYWRVPGDSGIPPLFDFSGSQNMAQVAFHWPRPAVFDSDGVETVGYAHELVLPVEIWPTDPAIEMEMQVHASLGVCEDVCLPVELMFRATLPQGRGAPDPAITAALDTVPTLAPAGSARCTVTPIADGLRLEMTLEVPAQGGHEWVFVEPARADVWVAPTEVARAGGQLTAVTELVPPDAKPFALDRGALRITVLSVDRGIEMRGCQAD